MAISRLSGQDATGTGTTTATATYVGATTANNLLIAIVGSLGSTSAGISTGGWTTLKLAGNATLNAGVFYKLSAGTETAIGATGGATSTQIAIFEYTGNANPIFTDGVAGATVSGGLVSSQLTPSISTLNPNDLIFSVALVLNAPNASSGLGWGNGSTLIGLNSGVKIVGGEKIVTGNQRGFTETMSFSVGGDNCITMISAFQTSPVIQTTSINNYQFIKAGDGMSVSEKVR
jgi:hypothetical protein